MAGLRIDDGFQTIVDFLGNGDDLSLPSAWTAKFYEKEITPPGFDGGGPNDTTNMRNIKRRTKAPKKLISMTEMTFTAMYNSEVFDPTEVEARLNIIQVCRITNADGSQTGFWGYLDKFAPGPVIEGTTPTATLTVICTNQRHVPAGDASPADIERDSVYFDPEEVDSAPIAVSDLNP